MVSGIVDRVLYSYVRYVLFATAKDIRARASQYVHQKVVFLDPELGEHCGTDFQALETESCLATFPSLDVGIVSWPCLATFPSVASWTYCGTFLCPKGTFLWTFSYFFIGTAPSDLFRYAYKNSSLSILHCLLGMCCIHACDTCSGPRHIWTQRVKFSGNQLSAKKTEKWISAHPPNFGVYILEIWRCQIWTQRVKLPPETNFQLKRPKNESWPTPQILGVHFGDSAMPNLNSARKITPGNQLSAKKTEKWILAQPPNFGGTFWRFGNAKFEPSA